MGYGRRIVLESITAGIVAGDSIGLLGQNGSGKTTLLKTIAGILPPLGGSIRFRAGSLPFVGYVPQREALEHAFLLSNLEVVMMGICGRLGAGRFPGRAERDFALECLERTGVAQLSRKPFAEISGGQKQRVLIGRALMAKPEVMLLDEPTAGVDAEATAAISELLRSLNASGLTILMVNHDFPVVKSVAKTVWWVRNGKVEMGPASQMLTPAELAPFIIS